MSNCKNKEGATHHFACDCREARFRKLEAELKAMDEARLSAAAVIVGYQEKFSKQEAQLKAAREEIVQLKSFDWQNAMIDLTAERDRLREDLKDIPEQCNRLNDEKNRYQEALEKIGTYKFEPSKHGKTKWERDALGACSLLAVIFGDVRAALTEEKRK